MSGPGRPGPDRLPREHGTMRGARQHRDAGEQPCPSCGMAASAARHERYLARRARGGPVRRELAQCGEVCAYLRHKRAGEVADEACLNAWADYQAARRAARREAS